MPVTTPPIFCESRSPERIAEARRLSDTLHSPIIEHIDERADVVLALTDTQLELRPCGKNAPGPVYVDFVGGSLGFSRTVNRYGQLFKAVGFKKESQPPSIIDATAGLCHDAFLLACNGCKVTAIERSAVLHALIVDGIARASDSDNELQAMLEQRLALIHADALAHLEIVEEREQPDVVYLDPMFPERTKTALVKKEMRILRGIVGDDEDAAELLETARNVATKRVVVKRMKHAPELAANPMICYRGKTTRFDVYAPFPNRPENV